MTTIKSQLLLNNSVDLENHSFVFENSVHCPQNSKIHLFSILFQTDCTVNDPCGLGKVCKEKVCQECVHFCSIFEICTNTAQPCRVKACSECIAQ